MFTFVFGDAPARSWRSTFIVGEITRREVFDGAHERIPTRILTLLILIAGTTEAAFAIGAAIPDVGAAAVFVEGKWHHLGDPVASELRGDAPAVVVAALANLLWTVVVVDLRALDP